MKKINTILNYFPLQLCIENCIIYVIDKDIFFRSESKLIYLGENTQDVIERSERPQLFPSICYRFALKQNIEIQKRQNLCADEIETK